jgi:MFS family permease
MTRKTLFGDPDFVSVWSVGALGSTARWLEMLVVGVFVFDQTGSPFLVALMLVLRMLPMGIFGLAGGMLAEHFDRRRVLLVAMGAMFVVSVAQGVLAANGLIEVWHIALGAFMGGLMWITDFPVRRTLLADIAGPERVGRAMSLDITSTSGTRMLGPLAGGALLASTGLAGAYLVAAIAYALAFVLLVRLADVSKYSPSPDAHEQSETVTSRPEGKPAKAQSLNLRELLADVGQIRSRLARNPPLAGIFAVTIVFNVWCFPFVSMIPVFGRDFLELSPAGIGMLAGAEGAGALLGAGLLAVFAVPSKSRFYYSGGVIAYTLLVLTFTALLSPFLSFLLMIAIGFAGALFAAMQSALVIMNGGIHRQQMMGVLSVCIGTGPIGFLHLGVMANLLGPRIACAVVAAEGLVAVLWVLWRWPALLSTQGSPRR